MWRNWAGDQHCAPSVQVQAGSRQEVVDAVQRAAREGRSIRGVGAGITIHALNRRLAELDLALANLGDVDRQSIAGAIATATHGTGRRLSNISSQVEALELVTGDGSVVEVDGSDPEMLRAARVGLGALGIVTAVTLRC